jgi:hypothetical protein
MAPIPDGLISHFDPLDDYSAITRKLECHKTSDSRVVMSANPRLAMDKSLKD